MRKLLSLFTGIILIAYPVLVYFSITHIGPRWVSIGLATATLARLALNFSTCTSGEKLISTLVMLFCGIVFVGNNSEAVLYYPVLMNLFVAILFLHSLRGEQSLIQRLYRLTGQLEPPEAIQYMRHLTALWGALLLVNTAVAAYTACCTSPSFWALYNGGIVYCIFAIVMAIEWIVRQYIKKSHASPLVRTIES